MTANEQRTGTLLCWLFGHKFVEKHFHYGFAEFKDKCIRCGKGKV